MKIAKSILTCLLASLSMLALQVQAEAPLESKSEMLMMGNSASTKALLKQISDGFSVVAQVATPSVVFIEVKSKMPVRQQRGMSPFDFFGEEFFRRFGLPYEQPQETPQQRARPSGQGSGFLISEDGYIVTNNHVVKDADEITVTLNNGRQIPAEIVGTDPDTDLAVIKIEEKNLPHLRFGNSDDLDVGEWVIAIGSPFGLNATVTVGVVSAKGRNDLRLSTFEDFIQTDAAINPGNSGGPLLDLDGSVIGINSAIVSGGAGGYMGIGFAIPSNMAKEIIGQIIDKGTVTRGFMGVTLQAIDQDLAKSFNLQHTQGVLITEVVPDSPAESAGLKQGDVILEYDGTKVKSLGSFRNAVALMHPEAKLKLVVDRDGQTVHIDLTIGVRPDSLEAMGGESLGKLGIEVEEVTPEIAQRYGYQGVEKGGVIVTKVLPGSIAQEEGISPGTIILSVNKQSVTSVMQFHSLMKEAMKNKHILFLLKQGPFTRFLAIKIGN